MASTMRVVKLRTNKGLPNGIQSLAIVRNGKEHKISPETPRAIFLTASLISHEHTLVPSEEALKQKLDIIHHTYQSL